MAFFFSKNGEYCQCWIPAKATITQKVSSLNLPFSTTLLVFYNCRSLGWKEPTDDNECVAVAGNSDSHHFGKRDRVFFNNNNWCLIRGSKIQQDVLKIPCALRTELIVTVFPHELSANHIHANLKLTKKLTRNDTIYKYSQMYLNWLTLACTFKGMDWCEAEMEPRWLWRHHCYQSSVRDNMAAWYRLVWKVSYASVSTFALVPIVHFKLD